MLKKCTVLTMTVTLGAELNHSFGGWLWGSWAIFFKIEQNVKTNIKTASQVLCQHLTWVTSNLVSNRIFVSLWNLLRVVSTGSCLLANRQPGTKITHWSDFLAAHSILSSQFQLFPIPAHRPVPKTQGWHKLAHHSNSPTPWCKLSVFAHLFMTKCMAEAIQVARICLVHSWKRHSPSWQERHGSRNRKWLSHQFNNEEEWALELSWLPLSFFFF